MSDLCRLIWRALIGLFRPRGCVGSRELVLRHQLNLLRRRRCDALKILSHIEIGFVERQRLDDRSVLSMRRAPFPSRCATYSTNGKTEQIKAIKMNALLSESGKRCFDTRTHSGARDMIRIMLRRLAAANSSL